MKKEIHFTLAFLFMIVYSSYSYNPKIIDTLKIHQQIKKFGLDEKILNFKANFFESIVFKNDSTIYYNPEGTLHLFEIHKKSLVSKNQKKQYDYTIKKMTEDVVEEDVSKEESKEKKID